MLWQRIILVISFVILMMDIPLGRGTVNMISRADGIAILIFFPIFIYYLVTLAMGGEAEQIQSKYSLKQAIAMLF